MIPAFKSLLGKIQAVASITSRISNAAWPHTNFNGKPKVCPWIGFDFCQVGVCSIRIPSVEIGLWRIWWKNFLFWTNAVILRFFAKFPKGDFVHDEPNHANGSQGNWKRIQQSLFKYWQTHSKVSSTVFTNKRCHGESCLMFQWWNVPNDQFGHVVFEWWKRRNHWTFKTQKTLQNSLPQENGSKH